MHFETFSLQSFRVPVRRSSHTFTCLIFSNFQNSKKLLYIEVDDEDRERKEDDDEDDEDSSSDENDSTAAAHAAAIGHSPQPFKPSLHPTAEGAQKHEETEKGSILSADAEMENNESRKESQEKESEEKGQGHSGMDIDDIAEQQKDKEEKREDGSTQVKKKLERDLDIHVNERDEDENTALHIAILSRKLDHVKVLLEAGASFRLRCDGSLPIHTAISMGAVLANRQFSYECVVTLHEHGADLTAKDDSLHTPLYLTCMFNQPQIASYILSDEEGLSTLNTRADRAGNRALHAAARYDTIDNPALSKSAFANATGQVRSHHHPDGSVVSSMHTIPSVVGNTNVAAVSSKEGGEAATHSSTEALLTQVLLGSSGVEIDATNVMGRTPLHVACSRGNWSVARLLIQAGASTTLVDRRGFTPGQVAYKKGMSIPNDLVETLGDPPETGTIPPIRDLLVDPDGQTMVLCHELCLLHRTCPPIRRNSPDPPPENVRRLHVLVDAETGILQGSEFSSLLWRKEARRVAISDVLKVSFMVTIFKCSLHSVHS
jgi:ankyrin repeat protein